MDKWISVKDRLPSNNTVILAWSALDNECVLASLKDKWVCYPVFGDFYYTECGITHWMPLPEKPVNAD